MATHDEPTTARALGTAAALYLALAYLAGIAYFLFAVDYPNIHDPLDKIALFSRHLRGLQITYLAIYVAFGLALVVLASTLHDRLAGTAPRMMRTASVVAFVWAGVLIAGGMATNHGMETVVALHADDPAQAATVWIAIESITSGMTGANGELLGGLWTLLVSLTAWRARAFPRFVVAIGLLAGAAGLLSTVPGLGVLVAVFGLAQLVWFVGVGAALWRAPTTTPALV